jgi:hypothetical protein
VAEPTTAGSERYGVMEMLGQGGMGAVYRALDRKDGSAIALKRLLPSPDATRMAGLVQFFHQEFRTLAQLAHPHVVRVYDYGLDAEGPYYTMELLEGEDLQSLAPLPWREACALARDVCSAVALLHSRGLLHRDLSPKNVKRTADGRAKLIDFGAMMRMGPTKMIIGAPPNIPPEALLQQSLDGRADLYALGATLYFALTGTHAYPARRLSELHSMWRVPPAAPSERAADIPPELDRLVLSLLSLDPLARPRSAAEVLDRLTAIASLVPDEQLAISNAYLSTPELVGRSKELSLLRTRLRALHAGRGGALWLEGAAGIGRSRMLDVCVLEAKLAGTIVARASALDASLGVYGVLGALLRALWEALPGTNPGDEGSFRTLRSLREGAIDAELDKARRAELHLDVRTGIKALARQRPLLLAIDDIERCDEPSQAMLASLAQACGRERVLLVVTCASGAADGAALGLLQDSATQVQLSALARAETDSLLGSVFGDVPHLAGLAARIHERAEGTPRGCMELAQHLVDHGLVRYHMGSWVLPATLDGAALPTSLSSARRAKLEALDKDARALGEALAIADGSGLDFSAYLELTEHGDFARMRDALDQLVLAQILRADGLHYELEVRVWVSVLLDGMPDERVQALAGRVADALERRGRDRLEVARYRWRAGQKERTIDTLITELGLGSRWDRSPADYADLLAGAVQASVALERSKHEWFTLLRELVRVGQDLSVPDMRSHLTALFAQLRLDSGLADWEATDAGLLPHERLRVALEHAQQRYDAAPQGVRGLAPLEAVTALTRLTTETATFAAQTADKALLDLFLPLDAFFPLAPVIEQVQRQTIPSCRAILAGRYEECVALHHQSLEALVVDGFALDEAPRTWATLVLHYALGCLEAAFGRKQALRHAEQLDFEVGWQIAAWSVWRIYHGTHGDLREAERCRGKIELLLLQSPVKPPLSAGAAHQYVFTSVLAEDLTGLRRAIPEMEALAALHPGLGPFVPFARAALARICGNCEESLALIEGVLPTLTPGDHPLWAWAAGSRLLAMLGLLRLREARELAARELAIADGIGLQMMKDHLEIPLALAQAKLGEHRVACERLERIIAQREAAQMEGVVVAWVYEARARVALDMGDAASFDRYSKACAEQYKRSGGNPALAAKYERLMQEARLAGVTLCVDAADAIAAQITSTPASTIDLDQEIAEVAGALASCTGRQQRAQRALELLLEKSGTSQGHLFLLNEVGLALAASTHDDVIDDAVISVMEKLTRTLWEEHASTVQAMNEPEDAETPKPRVRSLLLTCKRRGQTHVVGIAALRVEPNAPIDLPIDIATAVARALIDAGDVHSRELTTEAPETVLGH